jgi:hypothetical protein
MTRKIGEIIRASSYERDWGDGANSHRAPSYQGRDSLHGMSHPSFSDYPDSQDDRLAAFWPDRRHNVGRPSTQSKPAMIAFLDLDWRRNYPDESLNTGVSFRKDDSGSNLGE